MMDTQGTMLTDGDISIYRMIFELYEMVLCLYDYILMHDICII